MMCFLLLWKDLFFKKIFAPVTELLCEPVVRRFHGCISRWQQNSKVWLHITCQDPASSRDKGQSHFIGSFSSDANKRLCNWPWEWGELEEEHPNGWRKQIWLHLSHLDVTLRLGRGVLWAVTCHLKACFRVSRCTLWVIVLGGWSPQHRFAEINHAASQILAWMSALPGAYCECAGELRESHPLLSGPVVAPVFGEPCSWCPWAPLDFWLSEQTAAGKKRRQLVCKIPGEAQGDWEGNMKKL